MDISEFPLAAINVHCAPRLIAACLNDQVDGPKTLKLTKTYSPEPDLPTFYLHISHHILNL